MCKIQNTVVAFEDSYLCEAKKLCYTYNISLLTIVNENELQTILRQIPKHCNITIVGEYNHFTGDIFKMIIGEGNYCSIVTAYNIIDFKHIFKNVLGHEKIQLLSSEFIDYNTVTGCDSIVKADSLFISGHGDYLCVSLGNNILCSRKCKNTNIGHISNCVSGECIRINRIRKDYNYARKIPVKNLSAKLLFISTCAGISLADQKYSNYCHSLAVDALLSNALVYISKYSIASGIYYENALFYMLLTIYKHVSKTVSIYNEIMRDYFEKPPLLIMMGYSNARIQSPNISLGHYSISDINQKQITLNIKSVNKIGIHYFELALDSNIDISTWLPTSDGNSIDYSFLSNTNNVVTLYIKSNGELFNQTLVLNNFKYIFSNIKNIKDQVRKMEYIKYLMLPSKTIEKYAHYYNATLSKIRSIYFSFKSSKMNVKLNTMLLSELKNIQESINIVRQTLISDLINVSTHSDTHLVLNSDMLNATIVKPAIPSKCYICLSSIYQIVFTNEIEPDGIYYYFVCPKCEIYMVTSHCNFILKLSIKQLNSSIIFTNELTSTSQDAQIYYGITLINTSINFADNFANVQELKDKKIELDLSNLNHGFYYIRAIAIQNNKICISHRHLFI